LPRGLFKHACMPHAPLGSGALLSPFFCCPAFAGHFGAVQGAGSGYCTGCAAASVPGCGCCCGCCGAPWSSRWAASPKISSAHTQPCEPRHRRPKRSARRIHLRHHEHGLHFHATPFPPHGPTRTDLPGPRRAHPPPTHVFRMPTRLAIPELAAHASALLQAFHAGRPSA